MSLADGHWAGLAGVRARAASRGRSGLSVDSRRADVCFLRSPRFRPRTERLPRRDRFGSGGLSRGRSWLAKIAAPVTQFRSGSYAAGSGSGSRAGAGAGISYHDSSSASAAGFVHVGGQRRGSSSESGPTVTSSMSSASLAVETGSAAPEAALHRRSTRPRPGRSRDQFSTGAAGSGQVASRLGRAASCVRPIGRAGGATRGRWTAGCARGTRGSLSGTESNPAWEGRPLGFGPWRRALRAGLELGAGNSPARLPAVFHAGRRGGSWHRGWAGPSCRGRGSPFRLERGVDGRLRKRRPTVRLAVMAAGRRRR